MARSAVVGGHAVFSRDGAAGVVLRNLHRPAAAVVLPAVGAAGQSAALALDVVAQQGEGLGAGLQLGQRHGGMPEFAEDRLALDQHRCLAA